jgi:PAS domain S-box-containing protein
MSEAKDGLRKASDLRNRAEKIARAAEDSSGEAISPEAAMELLTELRVHQIELEMQNDELRRVQAELETAKERYADLYELAPVGYFTLSERGLILEANLTASTLLGVPRAELVRQPLTHFVRPDDQDIFYKYYKTLFAGEEAQVCEVRLARSEACPVWVSLEATVVQDDGGTRACRLVMSDITERKLAEEVIREDATELREAQRIGRFSNFDWDARTDTIVWSDEYYRIYGFDPSQAPPGYEEHLKTYSPESAARLDAAVKMSMQTGDPYVLDLEQVRLDGTRKWIAARGEVKRDANSKIIGLRGTAQDVTERKQAEEASRESEERYRSILNASPDGITRTDLEGRMLGISPAALTIFGYEREEGVLGHSIMDFIVPEDRDRAASNIALMFQGTLPGPGAYRALRADGSTFDIEAGHGFIRDAEGQPTNVVFIFRDITERKQAEEVIRKNEIELQEAQRIGNFGSFDWDARTDTIVWSDEIYRICGWDPKEKSPGYEEHLEIYTPESAARLDAAVKMSVQTGEPYVLDLEEVRPDGTRKWITARGEVKRDANNKIIGLRGTVQDITERKAAEEELAAYHQSLEVLVEARTADLEEANRQLREATRAKSDFLAAMSHELRTPLNSIIGFSGTMLQGLAGDLNSEQTKQLGMINNSGQHLLELINEVLDLSKVESAQNRPRIRSVDVGAAAREMFDTVRPMAEAMGIELRWTCPEDLRPIRTDRLRVSQILLNLMGNAIKFTEHGYVSVAVSQDGSGVAIAVKDSGRGIAAEDLKRVFDDFYQVTPHSSARSEGTGLGLAVSRRLAESIGARIELTSELGRGSVFTLRIPERLRERDLPVGQSRIEL